MSGSNADEVRLARRCIESVPGVGDLLTVDRHSPLCDLSLPLFVALCETRFRDDLRERSRLACRKPLFRDLVRPPSGELPLRLFRRVVRVEVLDDQLRELLLRRL